VPDFHAFVAEQERASPRWIWDDTARWYPALLRAGIRVQRCHDLRLSHVILRNSSLTAASALAQAAPGCWDGAAALEAGAQTSGATLFDLAWADDDLHDDAGDAGPADEATTDAAVGDAVEFRRQQEAVASSAEPGRMRLLLAAESAGALIACEMQFAGLPWRTDIHDRLLTSELGPRVTHGTRPARLEKLAAGIRAALADATLNPDSPQELLKSLQRAGLGVTSTRAWELKRLEHPVIAPLLEYKKLSRLLSANGWYWMDTWITDGRFHPDYVPGGVVTGRWATRGGGALQLPKQVRGAVVADDGWKLVVADAAQLEPRILAALSADTAMANAGRGTDLYAGIVASGVVETRAHAKVAMLGAMYGATTGESGRLLPRLARAYPKALALTEAAARAGERGESVTTRLGRSSPRPGENWLRAQSRAYDPSATSADERRARSQARDWGRFTRNFIVQGSAAEWALCWMAEIRKGLQALPGVPAGAGPDAAHPFTAVPHLVFFLHDEVIVHTPAALADRVATIITEAAATAGRLLFGGFPVDFLLSVAVVDSYADAK
jgi:DNA polymerase-1